jgi:hypothetical protein
MFCTECGGQASGRFCAHCGAATDPSPLVNVADAFAPPKPQTLIHEGTPARVPDPAGHRKLRDWTGQHGSRRRRIWIGVVVFLAGVGVLLVVGILWGAPVFGPPLMLGGILYAISPTKGQRWMMRTVPRSEQASSGAPEMVNKDLGEGLHVSPVPSQSETSAVHPKAKWFNQGRVRVIAGALGVFALVGLALTLHFTSGTTSDTSVGGSSNTNGDWMQQCVERRLANGDPSEQANYGDGGRSVAVDLCSHGADWNSATSNLGVAGANE